MAPTGGAGNSSGGRPGLSKEELITEFGSFLDEAVIIAITRDFGDDFAAARSTLTKLAETAWEEQATGFDPFASQNSDAALGLETLALDKEVSSPSDGGNKSGGASPAGATSATPNETLTLLREMFPGLKDIDLNKAVESHNGDLTKATEELQTLQYLEDTGQRPKGVDGLAGSHEHPWSTAKGKGKKKQKALLPSPLPAALSPAPGRPGRKRLLVDYNLKPLDTETEERSKSCPPLASPDNPASTKIGEPETLIQEAVRSRESSAHSFASASRAFIRGRSDPLSRQVAGFYADRGHGEAQRAREAQSEANDLRVARQSSDNEIDLHGVTIYDGVRIALEKTEQWWADLGPGRITRAKSEPLVIITGAGRHNTNGVSRLRQSVGAALKRDGWKYVVEEGRFIVKGKL